MAEAHNRIAIVTGAGSGIGKASAVRLLEDGWRVVFAGRRLEALREAIAAAGDPHGDIAQRALAVSADMTRPDSLARAWALGMAPKDRLADNDGHGLFEALGDAVVTGPTLTNVNDFRAIFIDAPSRG